MTTIPVQREIIKYSGISIGSLLATNASWSQHKSFPLAFIHGIFGWLYVAYFSIYYPRKVNLHGTVSRGSKI